MGHNAILILFFFVVLVILFVGMVRFVLGHIDNYAPTFNNTIGQTVFFSLTYLDNYINDTADPTTLTGIQAKLDYLSKDPVYKLRLELERDYSEQAHAVIFKTPKGVVVHRALYKKTLFAD